MPDFQSKTLHLLCVFGGLKSFNQRLCNLLELFKPTKASFTCEISVSQVPKNHIIERGEPSMKKKVLLVEDEELMREVIKDYFEDGGFAVTETADGAAALEILEIHEFDVILLDIMIPEIDGFSVCRRIRKTNDVPIIMITARSDEDDKLLGYELGADDYVTKPFSPKVLLAKANALIKRNKGEVCGGEGIISAGGITVDQNSHTVAVDGTYIELTPKEYDLLVYLMKNRGRVLSRDTLLSKVWGYDYFGDLRTVDTHIKKLRAKLGDKAVYIKTLIKAGYKFEDRT